MEKTISVGGVTFTADQVVTVTVLIDGREIEIGKKEIDKTKQVGYDD